MALPSVSLSDIAYTYALKLLAKETLEHAIAPEKREEFGTEDALYHLLIDTALAEKNAASLSKKVKDSIGTDGDKAANELIDTFAKEALDHLGGLSTVVQLG